MLPDVLLEIAATLELFHTATGVAFADLRIEGHRETWPVRSRRLRGWLRRHYYEETGEALAAAAVRSALDLMEARAQFDAPERSVHARVAAHANPPLPRSRGRALAGGRDRNRGLARESPALP